MASSAPDDDELSFRQYIKDVFDGGFRMGLNLGCIQGAKTFFIFLASQKFGPPSDNVKASIGCFRACNYLQYLSTRIADASSWDDLLYNALPYEPETGLWDDPCPILEATGGAHDPAIPGVKQL